MSVNTEENGTQASSRDRARESVPSGNDRRDDRGDRNESRSREQRANRRASVSSIEADLARPMSIEGNGELLTVVKNKIQDILKDNLKSTYDGSFGVLALDRNQIKTGFSVLVIYFNERSGNSQYTGAFKLILEGTGSSARLTRPVNIGSSSYTRQLVAGDLEGPALTDKISRALAELSGASVELYDAGTMVIHNTVDPEKHEGKLKQCVQIATQACFTVLDRATGQQETPFSPQMLGKKTVLSVNIDSNPTPLVSAGGLPIRTDFSIELSASENRSRDDRDRDDATDEEVLHSTDVALTRLDGYMDLVYIPQGRDSDRRRDRRNRRDYIDPLYQPALVITRAANRISALTMELFLLSIATSTIMDRRQEWVNQFLRHDDARAHLRDIGAIGYELAPHLDPGAKGELIDTQRADFDRRALNELIEDAMSPDLVVRMHIEESGDQSWLSLALLAAAEGGKGSAEVADMIYKAADNLTDGNFGDRFKELGGTKIAIDLQDRIILGTYKDKFGEARDPREVDDYLAALNLFGKNDMDIVEDLSNTHDDVDAPLAVRLHKRTEILRHATNETLEIKAYARAIEFTSEFIEALVLGLQDADMDMRSNGLNLDYRQGTSRGRSDATRNAIRSDRVSNLYRDGGRDRDTGGRGSAFGRGRYANRW